MTIQYVYPIAKEQGLPINSPAWIMECGNPFCDNEFVSYILEGKQYMKSYCCRSCFQFAGTKKKRITKNS